MAISSKSANGVCTITLGSSFDFECVNEFRSAYVDNPSSEYQVDFRQTEYMESSGLGMLLNMMRYLGEGRSRVKLINCQPQILKVLKISNFQKKFEIS
jgi:anti-anti-sigma factor